VLNNFEKKPGRSGLFINKLAVDVLWRSMGRPYSCNLPSALAKPSESRVNNAPEASARYSRCRLTASRVQAAYFEEAVKASGQGKLTANWMNGELAATLNKAGMELDDSPITAPRLAALVGKIADGTLSSKLAKKAFEAMWAEPEASIAEIIEKHGLQQMTDTGAIEAMVDEVLANNAKAVEQFKSGNEKALNAIVGQVMKASKGKANPAQVQELIKAKLA